MVTRNRDEEESYINKQHPQTNARCVAYNLYHIVCCFVQLYILTIFFAGAHSRIFGYSVQPALVNIEENRSEEEGRTGAVSSGPERVGGRAYDNMQAPSDEDLSELGRVETCLYML